MSDHYDVIIIGTGAGGGTLAHRLAPIRQAHPAARARRLSAARAGELGLRARCSARSATCPASSGIDKDGKPFKPHQQYFVGGNTKFYGAILFRLRERDFGEVRHHGGVSPAWPLSYEDLEPYYGEAEELYHVHGKAGEDPTEPPALGPVPLSGRQPRAAHPAAARRPRADRAPAVPPAGRRATSTRPTARRRAASAATSFDGFPCMVDGKADAHVLCVRPAIEHDNVTLVTGAKVERLETDAERPHGDRRRGRARRRRGELQGRRRRRVVRRGQLRGAAAALGQRPAPERARATPPDVVGRHYMAHINSAVIALSKEPNPTQFQKTLGVNDYYCGRRRLRLPARAHPDARQDRPRTSCAAGAPGFAPAFALDYMARHAVDFWLTTEDLPQPGEPRDGRPRRQASSSPTPTATTEAAQAPARQAARAC